MHETIINGRKYSVCDTVEETFVAFFGEKIGRDMMESMNAVSEPKIKCVYLVEFNNGWCKIGVAKDFDKRLKTITNSSGATPLRWCHTVDMPVKDAYRVESSFKKKFAPYRQEGEFFNIPYDNAYAELVKHAAIDKTSLGGGVDNA